MTEIEEDAFSTFELISDDNVDLMRESIETILAALPSLSCEIQQLDELAVGIEIKKQNTIQFDIKIYNEDDKVFMEADAMYLQMFPLEDEQTRNTFIQFAIGLIDGSYRIKRYWSDHKVVKTRLEENTAEGWKPLCTTSTNLPSCSWHEKTVDYIQNQAMKN